MFTERLLEKNWVPDPLVRFQIRRLLRQRISQEQDSNQAAFIENTRKAPIAVAVDAANEQHYEVPAKFFEHVLGRRMKYSCGLFNEANATLDAAEEKMLAVTCERAELSSGQDILELGCGWGSLTLFMAERYPQSRIFGVSNSKSQREFILDRARRARLFNVDILTCDMNEFQTERRFDRVVSVEMFEHMRNIELLLSHIATWLKDNGKLFVHIFSHQKYAYLFENQDASDWMARHFFSGGMMPSHDLYRNFSSALQIEKEWIVSGAHYALTAECWLANMDRNEKEIRKVFAETYGEDQVALWWSRWRVFFMACAELWGWNGGSEWQVSHFRFGKVTP